MFGVSPTSARETMATADHREAAQAPLQYSLRSLLIFTAVASICVAIGVHLAGVLFALAVMVLLQVATMLLADWLIRPQNRHALAFVTAASWMLLGSVFVILGGRIAYGAIGTAYQSLLWATGMCIAGTGVYCYYIASRRWRRLKVRNTS
jgi:low temperature requirement protein LtrA